MPNEPRAHLQPIVVMGVSGSGKSVVGNALADATGRVFVDGDDLHPAANKVKMHEGIPLTDVDREPWLRLIGERLAVGDGVIIACSALRRVYRDLLREYAPDVYFAHLNPSHSVLAERLATRAHEFMPASLLDSQLGSLEPLGADENGADFTDDETVEQAVESIRSAVIAERD